jgi:hypothetical protein
LPIQEFNPEMKKGHGPAGKELAKELGSGWQQVR